MFEYMQKRKPGESIKDSAIRIVKQVATVAIVAPLVIYGTKAAFGNGGQPEAFEQCGDSAVDSLERTIPKEANGERHKERFRITSVIGERACTDIFDDIYDGSQSKLETGDEVAICVDEAGTRAYMGRPEASPGTRVYTTGYFMMSPNALQTAVQLDALKC